MDIRIDMGKGVELQATLSGEDAEAVAEALRDAFTEAPRGTRTGAGVRLLYVDGGPALVLPDKPSVVIDVTSRGVP